MTNTATAQRFRYSAHRLVSRFADQNTVTLRRRSTLSDRSTGKVPSLSVNGLTAADSALINLDASYLSGTLAAGTELTLAGDGTTYTVQSDVTASSNQLDGVEIDPPLTQQADDDVAVTLASSYADTSVNAAVSRFADELIDNTRIEASDRLVLIDVLELGIDVGMSTEVVVGGKVYQIKNILPVQPGLEQYALRLHVGSR